ncbi:MAG TPA: tetratricopeptide repeat protein [Coleofasciculaceae cyanobacterium]|jgi:CHAT domain-containing protein/predicted negative regulator of RcsB-dependent stress response
MHSKFLSHPGFAVVLSLLLLPMPITAAPSQDEISLQQSPVPTKSQESRAAAERTAAEAEQLFKQGTAQSRRQAIAKYEEAVRLWRALGDVSQEASTLHSIGLVYYSLGEKQQTLDYYNQALSLRRTLKQTGGEAGMLWAIAGVYKDLGDKQKSLDYYNQALPLLRAVGDRSFEAMTFISLGQVYASLGEPQKAIASFNQAIEIQRSANDKPGEAQTLHALGFFYVNLGENQKALDSLNQSLQLWRALKDSAQESATLQILGTLYFALGENQKALDSFNQVLSFQRAVGDEAGAAAALMSIAGVYSSLGDQQKAIDHYNQALVLQRKVGNRGGEAEVLSTIGLIYDELGQKQKAVDSFNQARSLSQAEGNRAREAFALNNIAGVYNSLGEKQQALDSFNQALLLQRAAGDAAGEAQTLGYIAEVYNSLGNYQLSLDFYNQALSRQRTIGDRREEATTLDKIGAVYRLANDNQKALDSYKQALLVWRTDKNPFGEAFSLTNITRVYEELGDYQNALASASQALSLWRGQGNRVLEASALAQMGRVYRSLGNYQQALDSFNQTLSLMRAVGNRFGEAAALENLAKVYEALGDANKTLDSNTQALSLWRTIGDRSGEAETLYRIALTERKRGNLDQAKQQIEAGLNIVESLRSKVLSQELRTSYFASVQKYYQFYIDLLMQLHKITPSQGYDALALNASERSRARSLLEILTEANADIRQGVDPKLLEKKSTLQQQLDAIEKRRIQLLSSNPSQEQAQALETEISALLDQYRQVEEQLRATSPRYAALTQPKPLTLAEIQQQVLDDDTLLLEYSLGEERSYLWAVTKTGITSYELPKRADIETAAQGFRNALLVPTQRLRRTRATQAAAALSRILLEPVAQQLGSKRLLLVSEGTLQYVPFAALPKPNPLGSGDSPQPLVMEHEIVNLPSASTLAVLRKELKGRKPASKTIAVLADPVFTSNDERIKVPVGANNSSQSKQTASSVTPNDVNSLTLTRAARESDITFDRLPFSRKEAEDILALVPVEQKMQVLDFAASRAIATSPQLSQYRIVHFATHGILNSVNPELSGIVLSLMDEKGIPQNGFLRLHDVFNLNLPAELVVLSACQTGLGQLVKGEGLVGLTRGFMYAGAPRVLVSLWSVDDEATSELMNRFYKKMLQEGQKPAAALRSAQIEMWQHKQWQAPYYWAAFTLQGEWQ